MGFVNSCWPFGQQLYKLNIAEILRQTQEAVEKAEEAVEAAKKLQTGSVVSVNEIAPDENGNVEIPGFSIYQRCAQANDFKGYWDGKSLKDFAINMGFKEVAANVDLSSQLHLFPAWLSGAYTINGIPFTTSFAYAFGDPTTSSKDIVVINPSEGEIIHFYLDGNVPKSEVISGSGGTGGGGTEATGAEKIVEYTVDADAATATSFTFTVSDYPKLAQYNRLRGVVKKYANSAMPWVNVILNDTRTQPGPNIIGATAPGNFGMFGFDITKHGSYFMGGVTSTLNPSLYYGFTSHAFASLAQKRFTPLYLSELQYIVVASYTAFLDEGGTIEIWGWNE